MQADKDPRYLRGVAESVAEFKAAFEHFLTFHVVNGHMARGIAPAVFERDGADAAEVRRAREAVDLAAGRSIAATGLTGCFISVQGVGAVDPIAAWHTVTKPKPVLEPDDILSACVQMVGRLDELIRRAEAEAPPTVGAASMHPIVWGAARGLWMDGHFRQAVSSAAESLIAVVKSRTSRNDVSETALWQETFSSEPPRSEKPRLRWPGDPKDQNVKTMNEGLRQFAPGVQMTIRNPATHGSGEMQQQEALERLAALSLLARWIETCELIKSDAEAV